MAHRNHFDFVRNEKRLLADFVVFARCKFFCSDLWLRSPAFDSTRCFTFDNVLGSSLNSVKVSRFIFIYAPYAEYDRVYAYDSDISYMRSSRLFGCVRCERFEVAHTPMIAWSGSAVCTMHTQSNTPTTAAAATKQKMRTENMNKILLIFQKSSNFAVYYAQRKAIAWNSMSWKMRSRLWAQV